jgi:hypothetical protein
MGNRLHRPAYTRTRSTCSRCWGGPPTRSMYTGEWELVEIMYMYKCIYICATCRSISMYTFIPLHYLISFTSLFILICIQIYVHISKHIYISLYIFIFMYVNTQEPEITLKRISASSLGDIAKHSPELAQVHRRECIYFNIFRYVYIYVFRYVYVHVNIYLCIYVYTYTSRCIFIYTHIFICIFICAFLYIYYMWYMYACMYMHICIYMHVFFMFVCMYIFMYAYTNHLWKYLYKGGCRFWRGRIFGPPHIAPWCETQETSLRYFGTYC